MVNVQIPQASWDSPCLDKLNALDWKQGFCVDFDGSLLGVRSDCPDTAGALRLTAEKFGPVVNSEFCDSLVSVKAAKRSSRRGVRHFNVLYSNHDVIQKSLDLNDVLSVFEDILRLATVTMTDHLVHIDDSRLFAWEADKRLISVVGPVAPCRTVVVALRPYLMPETTSFTSLAENGCVAFAPLDQKWKDRIIHPPLPLTDLVFLLEEGQATLGMGEAILRLYELSSGKLPPEKRIPLLTSALKNVRLHSVPIDDRSSLGQRLADTLGLNVTALEVPDEILYSET